MKWWKSVGDRKVFPSDFWMTVAQEAAATAPPTEFSLFGRQRCDTFSMGVRERKTEMGRWIERQMENDNFKLSHASVLRILSNIWKLFRFLYIVCIESKACYFIVYTSTTVMSIERDFSPCCFACEMRVPTHTHKYTHSFLIVRNHYYICVYVVMRKRIEWESSLRHNFHFSQTTNRVV